MQREKVPMLTPERTSHPFYTYDMIKGIPKAFDVTLDAVQSFEVKQELASDSPLYFTGNGTAFYAATLGSQILNLTNVEWLVAQGFELDHYTRIMPSNVKRGLAIGVSHSGITKTTVDALSFVKSRGAQTIGVTHFRDRPISKAVDKTLIVADGPDKSRCHTKTYVAAAAGVFGLLSSKLLPSIFGKDENLRRIRREFEADLLSKLELAIANAEEPARKAASELHRKVSKIFFAGAGPNIVTAREAALKIKETSYLGAEGMELEEMLHGPAMSFDSGTLVVIISPSGPSVERSSDLLAAAKEIGATTLVVSDTTTLSFEGADYMIRIPSSYEYLSPFLSIIPLYFFSYFLAVEKGNNPDYLRYLDQKYWDARNIIFPPGTH